MSTELCGLPWNGVVSFAVSHGSILGWRLKSVNQEQAVSVARKAHVPTRRQVRRRSAFTADLLGTLLGQHRRHLIEALRRRRDPHAEVAATEARIVADRGDDTWNVREREHGEHRREAADQ